jgi:putative nucleotidyltransferase with HDIG domain
MNESQVNISSKKESNINLLLNVHNLPAIPMVIMEVSKLLDDPMASATELGRVINKDQGLVTKVLTVANSPLYGLPRRVSTIEFAIVILGFEHIRNILIAISMIEAFRGKNNKNWDRKAYWIHSLITATAAKRLADDLGYHKSGEAFTAGLLHDLGISVIQRYFTNDFDKICEMVEEEQVTYEYAEESVLGLSHAEVGKLLAEKWNLPPVLSDCLLHHHKPSKAEINKQLAAIVHLSDYMTQKLLTGEFVWDKDYKLDGSVIQTLNLGDEAYLERFIQSYEKLFKANLESINIF